MGRVILCVVFIGGHYATFSQPVIMGNTPTRERRFIFAFPMKLVPPLAAFLRVKKFELPFAVS